MTEDETTWTRPLFADLTWDSTRDEVLAAVDEAEARASRALTGPSGYPVCGGRRGPGRLATDPMLLRQKAAGEEDQSVPGWDQGA